MRPGELARRAPRRPRRPHRRHSRAIPRPTSCRRRWPRPPTHPATRRHTAGRSARGHRGLAATRHRGGPGGDPAGDRHQGTGRVAAAMLGVGGARSASRAGLPDLRGRGAARRMRLVATDELETVDGAALVWLNSPANPTGAVLGRSALAKVVEWSRDAVHRRVRRVLHRAGVGGPGASPCWRPHPGGTHDGILAVHSLSKRTNMAGYRFGFVAGDPGLVRELLDVRKHAGMMVPAPVQAAAIAALATTPTPPSRRTGTGPPSGALRGRWRRASGSTTPRPGCTCGPPSGEPCWETVRWCAERGDPGDPGGLLRAGGRPTRPRRAHRDRRPDRRRGRQARRA